MIRAVVQTAEAWSDPEHPARIKAVEGTKKTSDSFTEEAIAFAVNQQMALLSEEGLKAWASETPADIPRTVGVLNAGNVPFVELQDFLAVILSGYHYLGTISSKSPYLMRAFARELEAVVPELPIEFVDADELFARADAVIASGTDETAAWVARQCDNNDVPPRNRLIRGHRYAVAVLDGRESEDDLERLAEDALLHEGLGCRSVAVIWAPEDASPDDVLDAFARFRGVFPAHPTTPGRLKMQKAFLEALKTPYAYGEGLEFLMSKGNPEPQKPGHIRWSEYADLNQVRQWLIERQGEIQVVSSRHELHPELDAGIPLVMLGDTQRPALDWCPDGVDTMAFLRRLS